MPCLKGQQTLFECASQVVQEDLLSRNATYSNAENQLEKEYTSSLSHGSFSRNLEYYVLPVVVHIDHEGGSENISDLQIQEAISNYAANCAENCAGKNPAAGK